MVSLRYIGIILFAAFIGCSQPRSKKHHKTTVAASSHPSSIIFGEYCGECVRYCAIMYCYNMTGNLTSLFVDSTDSYFKNSGNIICNTPISDTSQFQIVDTLVQNIPASFRKPGLAEQTFGCPDCTDGCGLYVELKQGDSTRKFHIDYNTGELDKEVKDFGELIKKSLQQLERTIRQPEI